MDAQEKNQALFMNVVMMFHALAWQQLGKIRNPVTDKVERNLDGARNFIDTLDMLREKTKGNLSEDEERFLNEILKELRLNYVEELKRPDSPLGSESTVAPESDKKAE